MKKLRTILIATALAGATAHGESLTLKSVTKSLPMTALPSLTPREPVTVSSGPRFSVVTKNILFSFCGIVPMAAIVPTERAEEFAVLLHSTAKIDATYEQTLEIVGEFDAGRLTGCRENRYTQIRGELQGIPLTSSSRQAQGTYDPQSCLEAIENLETRNLGF